MKRLQKKRAERPMRKEYDFSGAVVGKYAKRYAEGARVVRSAAKVKTPK
jgi:hypothetical protein